MRTHPQFRPAPNGSGTEVTVAITYHNPAGKVGAAFAKMIGREPEQQVREDLRRFKSLMETSDPFGEDTSLTGKPIVYMKGTGTWDAAFETITKAFKKLRGFADKENLKVDGMPITVFTSTDDTGFSFEAALPLAEPPKNPPRGEIAVGTSPQGHALKFVHRGSYDGLDNTYEAITNFLDEKRLEAKDMFIEQYVTDPLTTNEENLVVNVFVMIK